MKNYRNYGIFILIANIVIFSVLMFYIPWQNNQINEISGGSADIGLNIVYYIIAIISCLVAATAALILIQQDSPISAIAPDNLNSESTIFKKPVSNEISANPMAEQQIFKHLSIQHDRSLRHIDALDMKIAQGLAFNGIILSFIFDKLYDAGIQIIFLLGLLLIIFSMVIAVFAFSKRDCGDSPSPDFYKECNDLSLLKMALVADIEENDSVMDVKSSWFNKTLYINIIGLIFIIIGYYG